MKKIIYLILSIMVGIGILITIFIFPKSDKEILVNDKENNYLINSNAITMMYETEADSGEYQTTSDTLWPGEGYVFNERLSGCENGGTLSWNSETNKVIMESNTSDRCYVYFDVYSPLTIAKVCSNGDLLSECIKFLYNEGGEGYDGLYYHDELGTYTNANQEAGDNSYRYSGSNPNNYVCFGSDEEVCPYDYLYRIIGVFDEDSDGEYNVKLIKADYTTSDMLGTNGDYDGNILSIFIGDYKGYMDYDIIASYYYNGDDSLSEDGNNNWTTSNLNIVNLNTNYLNYLGVSWSNKILANTWYLGGMSDRVFMVKTFFEGERNNNGYSNNPTRYVAKIGLMYPSDYGYAAYSDAWSTNLSSFSSTTIKGNNWLYMGIHEHLITSDNSDISRTFYINAGGQIAISPNTTISSMAIRPTFYLNSDVTYVSGNGAQDNPIRIN